MSAQKGEGTLPVVILRVREVQSRGGNLITLGSLRFSVGLLSLVALSNADIFEAYFLHVIIDLQDFAKALVAGCFQKTPIPDEFGFPPIHQHMGHTKMHLQGVAERCWPAL